ncbi:hypothetical protein FHS95_003067 [Sphingomonas naasensis]|uniref:Uncharacterized protein n=1 Tax=Sphingomonas naasensis TaxID=1344951 RepID=A0A4S1WBQ0_9SPHN|nr:hypothetical protein [Sphingomonas naasensis]NIJ21364.1 hypothetical protein [Sphingomonas naasensis]TGX38790.1 hypothetical protein E5A74_18360 [Sphingomonas naasensis]
MLFDRPLSNLETIVRDFMRIEGARTGAQFNVPESRPGSFYRLYGGDSWMITFEYLDHPADIEVFQPALRSTITGIVCPDVRQRLMRNKSHILINVSHGVLGNSPELMALMASIGREMEGHSLPQFVDRLAMCAMIARIVCEHAPAQAVHWTQSDQIVPGDKFDVYAAVGTVPSPLHIHPYLFGDAQSGKVGIRTFGARHFIGREIIVEPSVLPWAVNYETILTFLRVATIKDGYVIPDGDTFGPEDRSLSYRVLHREAGADDVPLCELRPLLFREYGFVADDYVPLDRVINDRAPPPELMPEDDEDKMELVNEWREKRALAEAIGGRFEVRARDSGDGGTPPARPGGLPAPGFGNRPVFGRRKA